MVFLYWAFLVERQIAHDACLVGVCKKGSEAIVSVDVAALGDCRARDGSPRGMRVAAYVPNFINIRQAEVKYEQQETGFDLRGVVAQPHSRMRSD